MEDEYQQIDRDSIRCRGIYRGKRSNRNVRVISAITEIVRYVYIYDDGSKMTAEQSATRDEFAKRFQRRLANNSVP